jgi:osmotically inducible protein OsmC
MTLDKVQYTATAHTTGGRDGASRSADGCLDVKRSSPGTPSTGTNPEQLFAAGWSACCIGAIKIEAGNMTVTHPADPAIDVKVDLGTTRGADGLAARRNLSLPGMARDIAQSLVEAVHQRCPVSRATRGHIDVVMTLV